ncbi:MAG: YbaB/EbfC family nucleoid-associated protein [Oscillospiraceae bacterium]|jgi:DNA-binding YbaB/EbfC family protein|nr:YbaB/EbfC family nucleoid-associated protein [Oscillospiraceae bacterium]
MKSLLPDAFKKPSMSKLVEDAKRMQAEMETVREEIAKMEFQASSGGGVVEVVVSGDRIVKQVKIAGDALDDVEMLQDMVVVALNSALGDAANYYEEKMNAITGPLSVPGL